MTGKQIIDNYVSFYKENGHVQIPNAPLVPENDPTTLFTSSGMQPLIPYLAGEPHPQGKRFVNVQNVFRGQGAMDDIDEVGDNRHLTLFRMIGNWSLGDYFKEEQIPWMFTFLTKKLGIDPHRLYTSVFDGYQSIPKDTDSIRIWTEQFEKAGVLAEGRIFPYGPKKNWWSRAGVPENMPSGELGGPDTEMFYDFGADLKIHENSPWRDEPCHINCDCGRYIEIGNNVFMEYKKAEDGSFEQLAQRNVDFGGGLERLIMATENEPDVFLTSLFKPVIESLEKATDKTYDTHAKHMRMITAHLSSSCFIIHAGIKPSNKEQGYILRKLLRRSFDSFETLGGKDITPVLTAIVNQYTETDPTLAEHFEEIKLTILEEEQKYAHTRHEAQKYIEKKYKQVGGDEIMGEIKEISAEDAFVLYATHGLSPTQIKSLGFTFDDQAFAEKMKSHKDLSRTASAGKFKGGLADHSDLTIKGHTATHLLQQALRDVLGDHVRQTGSNITPERLRFDFYHPDKLTQEQIDKVEAIVKEKIAAALPVHFEMLPLEKARETGAIGLFGDKYQDIVKVYFIGDYSKELCGGPHVENTADIKSFKITKQEKIGQQQMRLYAVVS